MIMDNNIAYWICRDPRKVKERGGYCSNCKKDMPMFQTEWIINFVATKYCPHCGKVMKGRKSEK